MEKVLKLNFKFTQEDIKSLCLHVVETYGPILDKITYVQTFKALRVRYDQHLDQVKIGVSQSHNK